LVREKKKAILKSAEYLFSKEGFSQTTIRDISKESGILEASIYSYYKNKRNILFAIYGAYLENATKTLKEHFLGMKEPGPKLRKAIWHYLSDMKSNPYYAKILMMAQRESVGFYSSKHFQYLKGYSRLVLDIAVAGQKEGHFRQDISPRLIRNMAMGTAAFFVFDCVANDCDYDPHKTSDLIYQLVSNATTYESSVIKEEQERNQAEARAKLRKNQILKAAIQVFSSKGYLNSTISEIADRASLGNATLYEYFKNKEDILLSIPERYLQDLSSSKDIFFGDISDVEVDLRKLIWRWIWLLYTNEQFARILVLEVLRNIRFYTSHAHVYYKAFLDKIRAVVQKGQKESIFIRDFPIQIYLNMIIGTIDQFLLPQFLMNRPPIGIAELKNIVDAIVRAIKVRGKGRSD